ncbi:MAG: hypothetical protein MUP64_07005 [Anaerolineae bacterium]|jgi:hypothetical protein|nr:hypothetical protein [Anaerolineae bacterium]
MADKKLMTQPVIGLLTVIVVMVCAFIVALFTPGALPGPVNAVLLVGAPSLVWLPYLVTNMVWWRGWPAGKMKQPWAGLVNWIVQLVMMLITLVILMPIITGGFDFTQMFPKVAIYTILSFFVMLHLTFILGLKPFHKLEYRLAGVCAFLTSWVVGFVIYLIFCNWGAPGFPSGMFFALDFAAAILMMIVWQMIVAVLWQGWPFSRIKNVWGNGIVASVGIIVMGWITWLVLEAILKGMGVPGGPTGLIVPIVFALGAGTIFGTFTWGMAFETWPLQKAGANLKRTLLPIFAVAQSLIWYFIMKAIFEAVAAGAPLPPQLWTAVMSLNLFTAGIILYYGVWHRWPFTPPGPPPG